MNNFQLMTALASATLLLSGAAAEAQHRGGGPGGGERHQRASMMLRAADSNGDNSITRDELNELHAEMFDWMDRTGDGFLDEADQSPVNRRMRALHEERMEEGGDERTGRHHRRGPHSGGPEGMEHRQADTNEDGRISRDEFMNMDQVFGRLDSNEDGIISPEEMDEAVESRRESRRWWRN